MKNIKKLLEIINKYKVQLESDDMMFFVGLIADNNNYKTMIEQLENIVKKHETENN